MLISWYGFLVHDSHDELVLRIRDQSVSDYSESLRHSQWFAGLVAYSWQTWFGLVSCNVFQICDIWRNTKAVGVFWAVCDGIIRGNSGAVLQELGGADGGGKRPRSHHGALGCLGCGHPCCIPGPQLLRQRRRAHCESSRFCSNSLLSATYSFYHLALSPGPLRYSLSPLKILLVSRLCFILHGTLTDS